jgi:hypothetical protein
VADGTEGDKDRVTVLPEKLAAHRERLRRLHVQDREEGLPGVWLPEGLERKWPKVLAVARAHRSGLRRMTFQHFGARQAKLNKKVTPHGDIRLRRICWGTGQISGRCRSCWAITTWPLHRSIPM